MILTITLLLVTIFLTSFFLISRNFRIKFLGYGTQYRCENHDNQQGNKVFQRRNVGQRLGRLPPGPKGWPIVGVLPQLVFSGRKQHDIIDEWAKDFGEVFTFRIFSTRFVILNSLPVIQKSFQSADINDMAPIVACNKALGIPSNEGIGIIAASEGLSWKELRRFLISILRKMKLGPNSFENIAVEEAKGLAAQFTFQNGEFFDPANVVNIAVANITTRLTMGKTYAYDDEAFLHLTELADDTFEYFGTGAILSLVPELSYLPSVESRKGEAAIAEMFDFIRQSVENHRLSFDPSSEPRDMVECFLQEQHKRGLKGHIGVFNDTNLLQFTWDILIGGWQTTNTTILWYLYILAQHTDVQHRVQAEIDRVVGHGRLPGLKDRAEMPYVEATMAECYRFSGLLPIQIPHRARCDVTVEGYDVPAGSYVASNTRYLCSSSVLWDSPKEFRPERFLDEAARFNRRREAEMVEFGVGRRACPGEQLSRTELFIFFSHIFHQFEIDLHDDVERTMEGRPGLTVNPIPFRIRATKRF